MPIDPSIPKDNDLISTFPAAIREARQVVADYAAGDTPLEGITVGSSTFVTFVTAEELACVSGVASNIQDQIDGKDPAGTAAGLVSTHASSSDHDGRYYTETKVNTLLSGKADVTQLHNAVTVTDTTSINLTLTGQALSADAIFGVLGGTVCQGNDSRLSDARTPTAHTTGSHSDWPASVSMTEVEYLDGVSSSVQAQINGKEPAFTTLPINKGGTGSATQNFVDLTTSQSIAGDKNFTGSVTVNTLKVNSSTLQPSCSANFGIGLGVTDATLPLVQIKNTSAPADKKYVRLGVGTSGAFGLGRVNDAYSTETLFLRYDAGDNLYLSPAGLTALVVPYVASATNYHQFNSSAGGAPVYYAQGSASDVSLGLSSKGTGSHYFYTNNSNLAQFQISHNANAVNRTYTFGGPTGIGPAFYVTGTDANIAQHFSSLGTSPIIFLTQQVYEQFRINNTTSAVNFLSVQGSITGNVSNIVQNGSDAATGISINAKGAGGHAFNTGGGLQFSIINTPSAVNALYVYGNAASNPPCLCAGGSDANIDIPLIPKGSGRVRGTMLSFACERSNLPAIGNTFAFGNGNFAGLGAVMPYVGKLVAVGISGMGVNGTLTADAYIDGVANSSYQISLTGSTTNVKNYTQYATPLSFAAGTSINWQVSAVPTAGTGFIITFFVVFN